jgi:hypothetical protein
VPGAYNLSSCFTDGRNHCALDIAADKGTPIVASYPGTVVEIDTSCKHNYGKKYTCCTSYGNYVLLEHSYTLKNGSTITLYTRYAHMGSISVSTGQSVSKGTKLGVVGSTGHSTGFHLHYETRKDGASKSHALDPYVNDLLELDQSFRDKYYNYTTGKVLNMYGFEIYSFVNAPYFNKNGVKLAYNATPTSTDHKGSFAFYLPRMFRAQGSTKMYYSEAATNPQTQENLVNFRNYDIVLPKKMECIGAIYSWDGTTAQSKNQTATPEKRWAQVRKEAAQAAQASAASTTGDEGETD